MGRKFKCRREMGAIKWPKQTAIVSNSLNSNTEYKLILYNPGK